ncbi:MAG: hypothetical protein ACMUEM_02440 [Flavobacteriales bacterium AspAUS03]
MRKLGGGYRLMGLFHKVISSAYFEYYYRILLQYFVKRSCRDMVFEILKITENNEMDYFDMFEQAQSKFEEISKGLDTHPIDEYWSIVIEGVRKACNINKGGPKRPPIEHRNGQ